MFVKLSHKKGFLMISALFLLLSCIPRESPPDRGLYLEKLYNLPAVLRENSGMIYTADLIWHINDSGNEPALYGYDKTNNTVARKVIIKNTVNNDWEDVTQNDTYVFIGDFGNNAGSRTNLNIIVINKSDLTANTDTIIPYGIIEFNYSDQTDFTPAPENTPFDCEAFIATDNSILLFTKDWVQHRTKIYTLPVTSGNYTAEYQTQWDINGLITAAVWSQGNQELLLLGYSNVLMPFLWVISGFNPESITYLEGKRTDFGGNLGTQTEGMLIMPDGSILISSEEFATLQNPAALYILRGR